MSNKKSEKILKAGQEMNPKTGCRVGTVQDKVGTALLSAKDPVVIIKATTKVVSESCDRKDSGPAGTHRIVMGYINWLKEHRAKEFTSVPMAIELSRALRASGKPKVTKKAAPAKPKAKPVAKKATTKKPVAKKEVVKKEVVKPVVNDKPVEPGAVL